MKTIVITGSSSGIGKATAPLLVIVILLLLAPVLYGLKMWIGMLGAEETLIT